MENERRLLLGTTFHHMVYQFLVGVSAEKIETAIQDAQLHTWWLSFQNTIKHDHCMSRLFINGARLYPEISLSAPILSFRLVAKYDLVVILPEGGIVIVDWKTSPTRPKRRWLVERMQTRVYPYLFLQAGNDWLRDFQSKPEDIRMIYWFAEHPDQPEIIPYTQKQYQDDAEHLNAIVSRISKSDIESFPLTNDNRHCLYCVYRSLCDRGVGAGSLSEIDRESEAGILEEFGLNFEQIAEVEY